MSVLRGDDARTLHARVQSPSGQQAPPTVKPTTFASRAAADDESRYSVPSSYQRPRSKYRSLDLLLLALFHVCGPADGLVDDAVHVGGRSPEQAARGYDHWDRTTHDGVTYLTDHDSSTTAR